MEILKEIYINEGRNKKVVYRGRLKWSVGETFAGGYKNQNVLEKKKRRKNKTKSRRKKEKKQKKIKKKAYKKKENN